MASNSALSKGCFIYKPKQVVDPFLRFKHETWNQAFVDVWVSIETNLKVQKDEISSQLMNDLVYFTKSAESFNSKIPTAVLLTGVNLPDHGSLFSQLIAKLKKNVSCGIAVLYPTSCVTVKSTIEVMTSQFMNNDSITKELYAEYDSEEEENGKTYKKSSCNMPNLLSWYKTGPNGSPTKKNLNSNFKLIVILPDFEGLSPKVVHDFLLILSCYMKRLPLVIIVGVATTASVIGDMLEHSVTSKLCIEIFQSQRSVHFLNNVLDKVFLTKDCPFQLGPKIFKFLINTFLFYDFSVQKFTLGIKYCIMDHFLQQPWKILCTSPHKLKSSLKKLNENDLNNLRQLQSYKKYLDTLDEEEQSTLKDSKNFINRIELLLIKCHESLVDFHICLRLLLIIISQLPGAPLGKQVRELYLAAMSGSIVKTAEFKECVNLLHFQGKSLLLDKFDQMITYMDEQRYDGTIKEKVLKCKSDLKDMGLSDKKPVNVALEGSMSFQIKSRTEFKEAMAALSKMKPQGDCDELRRQLIDSFMNDVIAVGLEPITLLPLHEIIVCDSVKSKSLKRNLVGSQRGDVHHALTQPKDYLMCDCCEINDPNEISPTLPDICIAYKLHLEFGATINLHDWMQSFATIVEPESAKLEKMEISPLIQARFMQAVSDLEYMGFIKSSKRKVDHVLRMSWGSCS